jgi:TRAP-type C4-dicarboxylate transport system permease small subunit
MNRNRTMGLVVAILSLLTTCCLCPLGINAISSLLSLIQNKPALGLYARLLGQITPRLPGYLLHLQLLCAGVVVLVITVLSFVIYFSARKPETEMEAEAEAEAEAYIETE